MVLIFCDVVVVIGEVEQAGFGVAPAPAGDAILQWVKGAHASTALDARASRRSNVMRRNSSRACRAGPS